MKGKALSMTLAIGMAAIAAPAMARSVFLNGVDISSVRGQTFKGATVFIDENGDIHMDAPGYKVEVVDTEAYDNPSPVARSDGGANPLLSAHYYLTTQSTPGNLAQYDLLVSVNGVERKRIKAGSPQVIMEISAWLQKGANTIEITAVKDLSGGRKSVSPSDTLQLLIGTGREVNKVVKIDVVNVEFKCDASQIETVKRRYTLNAI